LHEKDKEVKSEPYCVVFSQEVREMNLLYSY